MPEQETNQEVVEQPNPELEQDANSQESGQVEGTEAQTAPTESPQEPSKEELDELIELGRRTKAANITDPEALMRDYTHKSQALPELQSERERAMEVIRKLAGERAAAADPVEAAKQQYAEALRSFDPDAILNAEENLARLRMDQQKQQLLSESIRVQELKESMGRAKTFGDFSEQELGQVHQTISPEELALVRRYRQGDLPDVLNAETEKRKAEAQQKARMNQLFGQGSGGTIPGGFDEPKKPVIDWVDYALLSEGKRKELDEAGVTVINTPGG